MAPLAVEKETLPTLDDDIQELRRLLYDFGLKRTEEFYKQVHARHGDVPELAYWTKILGPAKVEVRKSDRPARDHTPSYEWIRAHAAEYWGEWLALLDGQLIAHGKDSSEVLREARANSPQPDFLFFYAGPYER
jgi:hypothetical protein